MNTLFESNMDMWQPDIFKKTEQPEEVTKWELVENRPKQFRPSSMYIKYDVITSDHKGSYMVLDFKTKDHGIRYNKRVMNIYLTTGREALAEKDIVIRDIFNRPIEENIKRTREALQSFPFYNLPGDLIEDILKLVRNDLDK